MIRIAALNTSWSGDGSQSNDSLRGQSTKEAKEAEAYALYNKALTFLRNGKAEEAEDTFRDLIDHDFLVEAYDMLEERSDSDNVIHPEFQLLYSIYKNLAAMATQRKDYRSAMESYLEAIKIDSSEVTVWFKIGQTALKIEDFQLAQLAFEQGLVCSPKHWPCLDHLITIMYALNNYFDCLYYIAKAFALDLHYEKGHAIRRKIIKEQPSLKEDTAEFYQYFDAEIDEYELDSGTAQEYVEEALTIRRRKQELSKPPEPERLSFPPKLKAYSWKCIGEEMISLYDRATTSDPIISICLKMKMPDYTDVPAAGEEPPADETETKDTPTKTGVTQGDEKMDTDGENVEASTKVEKVGETENIKNDSDGKESAMEVESNSENVKDSSQDKTEKVESKSDMSDIKKVEPGSKLHKSGVKQNVETLQNEAVIMDTGMETDTKQTEKEVDLKEKGLEKDQNVKEEGLNKDQKESEESEDPEMESDDSVLEAFKMAQTLLDGLSPCKDGAGAHEKKDSVDGITGPVSDNVAKSNEVQDLTEKLKEIEKELHVIKDDNGKASVSYEAATQGPGVSTHEEPREGTSGTFGSTIEQSIQKETTLTKSGSFGFTPSLFPEPSIRPSQSNLPSLTMPSASALSARSQPNMSPLVMPATTLPSTRSPLIGHSHLTSPLVGHSQGGSPLVGVAPPSIGLSQGASQLMGHMPSTSQLARQISASLPLAGMSSVSSPLIGPYPGISPLIGQMSSASPLAGIPPISSPFVGPHYNTSPLIGQLPSSLPLTGMSSPLIGPHPGISPLIGQMSSTSPLAVQFPTGSPLTGSLPTVSGFAGQGHPTAANIGYPPRTSIITQDHGYTIPALNVIPAPNLNISVSPTNNAASSPQKHSPILTSYLTSSTSHSASPQSHTQGSSQSPLKRQNSGGFGHENRQSGSGTNSPRNLNVPVTQSLHKTLDSPNIPSSLFIVDFEDQSPGGRRGQKRKKISMATEEIMMYGKRRSARVRNTGRRKEEETVNYMELLQAFLPSSLKTVQEDEVEESEAKTPDQSKSPVSMETESEKVESYENWNEEVEVKKFLLDNLTNYGLMILMRDYLFRVAKFDKCKWKDGLAEVFLSVFSRVRKHLNTPNIFCCEESQDDIREFSKVCLLWSELQLDKWLSTRSKSQGSPGTSPKSQNQIFLHEEDLPYNYNEDIWYIMACCGQSDSLAEFWNEHCIRAYWMKARLNMLLGNTEDAIACFERAKEYLQLAEEEETMQIVFVANVKTDNVITQSTVTAVQESLQQSQSVEEIQRLSETGDNEAVIELLLQTFQQPKHKSKFVNKTVDASERQSQLSLLQDTLFKLGDLQKCLLWGEESFHESYEQYQKSTTQGAKSEWLRTMVKIFTAIQRVLEKDLSVVKSLPSVKLVRLSLNLVQMIDANMSLHESVTEMKIDTLLPWVLLYQLIKHEEDMMETLREKERGDTDMEENMASSLMLLNVSHDYLGSRSWCCKSDGALLMFFMRVLKSKVFSESLLLDDYQQAFEQCVYCLYGHPNRKGKAKHLQDHNAPGVTLHWEGAIDVFEYFKPKSLPEFDGYKHDTITVEMECLLKRILPLIPESSKSTGLSADDIQNYIEGVSTATPDIQEGREVTRPVVNEIYYLLGDYYLKNKEVGKAIKFYIQDLCVNPSRLDSWAGMALARMSQLEQKLSSVELKMDVPVFRRSITALRCFKRAMEIDYSNCKLWIEYGSLAYILHAHASRQLQWKNWFAMKEDFLQIARDSKDEMLQTAYNCFIKSAECCDEGSEEEWIMNYMTGKCLEKMGKPAKDYLPFYKKASEDLHEGGARYPKKIVYAYTTPHYAVEALEMYFRQHISILKLLLRHPPDSPELDYKVYLTYIIQASRSPFAKRVEKGQEIRTDRDSASSADEGSCSALPSPSKQKNTKYKIPSDDHTYVRQKSNQGAPASMSDNSEQSQSQSQQSQCQSQEGVTLTSKLPSASSAIIVTTLELHSEQTSSQEQEMLTTSTAKCPEQLIDQKPPLLSAETVNTADLESSVPSATGPSAIVPSTLGPPALSPSGEEPVSGFMKSVNDAIDKAVKEELMDTNDSEMKSKVVSMETDLTADESAENKNKTDDQTVITKQERAETTERKDSTESDQSIIIIDGRDDGDEKSPDSAPLDLSTVKTDETEAKPEYSVEEMVAMELSKSREEIHRDLVEMCFRGVELCLKRFPTHYKSHYRLAYIYVHSPYHKNIKKARNILLGAPKWSQFDYMPCQGLFYERKPTKFFQGVWKIPIDEVDRSGSFPAHLNKCISLLLEVLRQDRDPWMLFQIHQNLNRQPEAGKKYLRDAERKFYTLQSFKTTLDAVEAQTNAMKLVTDPEARLKYLMTVYKIREHGVQKLNRDVEKLNRLFAEAYRVALRKLETLPAAMLLSEALRFCKHQHTKKTMVGDKNQNALTIKPVTSKQITTLSGKPLTVSVASKLSTSPGGITSAALKNIIGPQKISPGSQSKTMAGIPVQKISISTPSKTVTAAQKLISLAKISKMGKSQSVGHILVKGNKSNNSSATGIKTLKLNPIDVGKGTNSLVKKTTGAFVKPKGNKQNTNSNAIDKKDDVIVLSDESERENSPIKASPNISFEDKAITASAPAPTVKIKMGLLQLAKLKNNKAPENDKENIDESESEEPIPEDMEISVDEEKPSSSSSSSSSDSSSSDSDDDDNDDDSSSDYNDKSDASKIDDKSKNAVDNGSVTKKSGITVPTATVTKKTNKAVTKPTVTKKPNVPTPKSSKSSSIKQSLLMKCKRTVGKPASQKTAMTVPKTTVSKGTISKPTVAKPNVARPYVSKPPKSNIDKIVLGKANDTDDADDEGVTESEIDEVVILDDSEDDDDDKSQSLGDDSESDVGDDNDDDDYKASADEPDGSEDLEEDNDDVKDADVVMISESESEDEFAPKGRAIIPSPPHTKLKDMEKTVVLVSEMPDVDPIMSSIISSETD